MYLLWLTLLLLAPDADYAAGVAALKEKDAAAAEAALSRCVEAAPTRVDCRWELGWAYYLQGRWEEVVRTWETVLRLDPEHPEVRHHLETARAQADLAKALEAEAAAAPAPPAEGSDAAASSHDDRTLPSSGPPSGDAAGAGADGLTLRAVGDVMLGTAFPPGHLPPEDGAPMLAQVADLLREADLTFANLEGPLCDGGETKKCRQSRNCYAFRMPTRYGRYLAEAGIDLVSTANNHSGDFGEVCRRETERTLDALGIAWSGPPGSIASVEAKGLKVALVAFHTAPQCNWLNDQAAAEALVRRAAQDHDIVVVSFHGGAEGRGALHLPDGREFFHGEDRGDLRRFARGVVRAGADLVLGHGPHVPRAMEIYRGRLIAYSLGNFATYGRFNLAGPLGLGLVLEVRLAQDGRFVGGRIYSTRQEGQGVPVPDPKGLAAALVGRLSRQDLPETGVRVARDGSILPP